MERSESRIPYLWKHIKGEGMIANFKLSLDELNAEFIEKLKTMFNDKKIVEIHISEEIDETEYLLSTSANRESLFRSLQQLDNNEVVIKQISEIA